MKNKSLYLVLAVVAVAAIAVLFMKKKENTATPTEGNIPAAVEEAANGPEGDEDKQNEEELSDEEGEGAEGELEMAASEAAIDVPTKISTLKGVLAEVKGKASTEMKEPLTHLEGSLSALEEKVSATSNLETDKRQAVMNEVEVQLADIEKKLYAMIDMPNAQGGAAHSEGHDHSEAPAKN